MEKYKSNENLKNKQSTFSILRNFFRTAKKIENRFLEVSDRMEELKKQENGEQSKEYKQLSLEADMLLKKSEIMDKKSAEIKKVFLKVGTLALGTVLAITGTIAGISHGIQSSRENRVMEALSMQSTKIENFYKESPNELKKLSQSPEEVTQLALDTLKHKLADHYGVNNKDDFKILHRTERPEHASECTEYYQIFYKGKIVLSNITHYKSSDVIVVEDTMPKEIMDAIAGISHAQSDPGNLNKAYGALKSATGNKVAKAINTKLPPYLPGKDAPER